MKTYLVECEMESAEELRDAILDAMGYPISIEKNPALLKVQEVPATPSSHKGGGE